jgi:hypothetical protein
MKKFKVPNPPRTDVTVITLSPKAARKLRKTIASILAEQVSQSRPRPHRYDDVPIGVKSFSA